MGNWMKSTILKAEIDAFLERMITEGYHSVQVDVHKSVLLLTIKSAEPALLQANGKRMLKQIEGLLLQRYSRDYNLEKCDACVEAVERPDISARIQAEILKSKIES